MTFRLLPTAFLRWIANYGLSLSAADYALPEVRESSCPFAQLFKPHQKRV